MIGTTESIFVAAAHRPGGAGIALLRATEALARDLGATGLYVSGPAGAVWCGCCPLPATAKPIGRFTGGARMTALVASGLHLPAMPAEAIERVRRLEGALAELPQVEIATAHLFHAGVYARTIRIPAGVALTGALIKVSTVLIFSGHATVLIGGEVVELHGYHVIPASAGRKQAFVAHTDTDLTMLFPSEARSVAEAESEFTDEADLLLSHQQGAETIIFTGE